MQEDAAFRMTEQELSAETEEILRCLNEKDRELFRRIYLEEENPGEVGEALGISRDNVYVRIFRGKPKRADQFVGRRKSGDRNLSGEHSVCQRRKSTMCGHGRLFVYK